MRVSKPSIPVFLFMATMLLTLVASMAWAADTGGIPQRADVDDKYKWRVEDIYATIADWEADYVKVQKGIPGFDEYRGHLAESPEMLLGCLALSDSLDIIISNLFVFAYLKLDEDNRVSIYQELAGRAAGLNSELGQAQSFIRPEILEMDAAKIESMVQQNANLEIYRHYLSNMMRQKAHILSPAEERILALASQFSQAPMDVFQMIDNADHKLGSVLDSTGNPMELTYGRYTRILKGTDREARRIANDTVQNSWKRYINTLGANLGSSINKDLFFTRARGYNSTLERQLDGSNIPVAVFDNLITAVNENMEPLYKLTRLRKKMLGYDTLFTYDMSVPLVPEYVRKYPYDEAMAMVIKGLKPLGKQYVQDLKAGFKSGWVDVYETEGKATGGYNWGTYTSHPYIMMNYDGNLMDVFTLAHEMGHALNGVYSNRNEPYVSHGHSLFTAEVASTCNEAILMEYMLENAKDRKEKIAILNQYIEQIEGTFFTQVMFSEFEQKIHDHVQNGGAVSVDYFRTTYREIFQKYNGPDLFIGPDNDMGGLKIYHFYRTFYVYQYATGYAAAQMLAQKILDGDKEALARYMTFLETGDSQYPVDILKAAGVDVTSPEPVQYTLKLFGELVDELERLLEEEGM